jgi:protease-4
VAEYATAAISGYAMPGLPQPEHAVYMRLEHTPGPRGHVAFLRRLWRLSERSDIAAVTLVLRAEPADTLAHAEEVADAIRVLHSKGKKVLCSWEDAGSKALYACASADRIVVNPAGGVRYAGIRTQFMYFAGLLKKLGVRGDFVRISDHKSAPEQFTNEEPSPVAKADHIDLLHQYEAVFNKNLETYRHLSPEKVKEDADKGPFVASEAREAGYVDGYAFDDEVERATQDLVGRKISYVKWEEESLAPKYFGSRPKVAVLYVDGDMIDGRSAKIPIVDMKLVGSYSIAETVKALREAGDVKAVVLRIESGGGSSMAADVMWRELKLLADKKPLVVSMGSVAASGGYYVAAPAREIFALPLTVTGSIGVFYGKADVSGLLDKIGVHVETYKTAPHADADSMYRGFTEEERKELDHKIHQFYDVFLTRVSEGRHLSKEAIDAVGQGRVWSGQQALEHKLVDKMGGLRQALDEARQLAGLPDDAPIVEAPAVEQTLLDKVLDMAGIGHAALPAVTIQAIPPQIRDLVRAVAPLAVYRGDEPLAHIEWAPVDEPPADDP